MLNWSTTDVYFFFFRSEIQHSTMIQRCKTEEETSYFYFCYSRERDTHLLIVSVILINIKDIKIV